MTLLLAAVAALPASLLAPSAAPSVPPPAQAQVQEIDLARRAYWRTVGRTVRDRHGVNQSFPLSPDGDTPADGFCTHMHPIMDLLGWFSADDLLTFAIDTVRPDSWDNDECSAEVLSAFLMIRTQRDVQLELEAMFTRLASFVDSLDQPPVYEAQPKEARWAASVQKLREERITFKPQGDDGAALVEVADELSKVCHLDVRVAAAVLEERDLGETLVRLPSEEMTVHASLVAMREQLPWLHWDVTGESLVLHTGGASGAGDAASLSVEFYDVRPLLAAPKVPLLGDGRDEDEPMLMDPAQLEESLRNNVEPLSWEMNPDCSVRVTEKGLLIVAQTQRGHSELRKALKGMQALLRTVSSVPANE